MRGHTEKSVFACLYGKITYFGRHSYTSERFQPTFLTQVSRGSGSSVCLYARGGWGNSLDNICIVSKQILFTILGGGASISVFVAPWDDTQQNLSNTCEEDNSTNTKCCNKINCKIYNKQCYNVYSRSYFFLFNFHIFLFFY